MLVVLHGLVATGFWLDDAAHVRRRWDQWPAMEHVARSIPPEAKIIALRPSVDDQWMFLMYLSDRPVEPDSVRQPVATDANWIVTSRAEPDSPGFHAVGQVDDYKLETRNPRAGAGAGGVIGRKGS